MSLYNKYRPQSFDEMLGNKLLIESLRGLLRQKIKVHAYLLHGQTGCGKTTIARIISNKLGAKGNDFREVDSADFRGIDTIRDMRRQSHYAPLEGLCRVWLLDECHKLSGDAQSALLKALEDPPKHVYYILCTTNPEKLLPTVKGRCSQFQVTPLNDSQMLSLIQKVVSGEGQTLTENVCRQIVQDSLGLPRNALQILEQVLVVEPSQRLSVAKRSAELQSQTIELCRALFYGNWQKIRTILQGLKEQEPETIRRQVLGYFQAILLKEDNKKAALVIHRFSEPFYDTGFPALTLACYRAIKGF